MTVHPVELKRQPPGHLQINWSDGFQQEIALRRLRESCPCATCNQEKIESKPSNPLQILSPAETLPLEIVSMSPVGNYAYNIQFSDGHNTGIFTFDLLRQLSTD